ncbi:Alpha-galactosidase [Streptomyces sp. MBT84]|nr:Alpha-galactosidase [Streptomyces sp. MBT84]
MTAPDRWLLRTDTTTYAVALGGDGRWAELAAWGPHGAEDGPSPMEWSRRTHFITPADAAPAEYIPYGLRPFTGADLVAARPGGDRGSWWRFTGATQDGDRALRLEFADDLIGLHTTLCYETVPGTDVVLRWTELTCTGDDGVRLERFDSAAVNVPVQGGARLTYLAGQWSQEFQLKDVELERGRFEMESTQGSAGHAYHPWLAIQDAAAPAEGATPTYGIALEWSGNWRITADAEPGGAVRVRAGRVPHEGAVRLAPAPRLSRPVWPAPSARTVSTAWPASGTATSGT